MADVNDDLTTAINALQDVQTQLASTEPSLADNVLAAVTPVLTAAGWTAPVNTTTEDQQVDVSTDTPPAA